MTTTEHRTLSSETEIAAFLHRTRMAILAALRQGPATASQIADILGVHPANLTRHIRRLVDAGLVVLAEKRDTGRNLEKYYAATAATFDVAPETHGLKAPHKIALAFARSDLSAAIARLADDRHGVVAMLAGARIRDRDVVRFKTALADLISTFTAADHKSGTGYHINLCLYPGEIDTLTNRRIELGRAGKRTSCRKD